MLNGPFPPWPNFTQEEADAVSRVLLSNKVSSWTGDEVGQFEQEFARFAGADHAIALANGTLALDLALHGLRIGERNGGRATDEVIVTSRSFVASASCIVNAGAKLIFADVDRNSQNITSHTVEQHLTANTRAIICVHLAGWPCDMDGLKALVQGHDIHLIEDCAQAHGAVYKGRPVGGLGDVAAWSFCQDKIMSTGGEGGMVTCNDEQLWRRMWAFKDHGKSYAAVFERDHPPGFRWLHESIGTNWRMTEMQAAIGRIQLKRMPDWHAARTANATDVKTSLAPYAGENGYLRIPEMACGACGDLCDHQPACRHAYYKYYAFVRPQNLPDGWTRDTVVEKLTAQGLPCMPGTCSEIYLEKAFDGMGCRPERSLPTAKELGETSLMFLVHPGVTKIEIDLG